MFCTYITANSLTKQFAALFCTVVWNRPVESHSAARGNILVGPSNISRGSGPLEKFFLKFFFQNGTFCPPFISGRRRGPQTSRDPG